MRVKIQMGPPPAPKSIVMADFKRGKVYILKTEAERLRAVKSPTSSGTLPWLYMKAGDGVLNMSIGEYYANVGTDKSEFVEADATLIYEGEVL